MRRASVVTAGVVATCAAAASPAAAAVNDPQHVSLPKVVWKTSDGRDQYCSGGYVELYKNGTKVEGKTFAGYCTAKARYRIDLLGPGFPRTSSYGVNSGGYWSFPLTRNAPVAEGTWSACGGYTNSNYDFVVTRCANGSFK